MKNVRFGVKLRRLVKSLAVFIILFVLFTAGSAFSSSTDGKVTKAPPSDSLQTDKSGFKSLFVASDAEPSKPFTAQLHPKVIPFVQNYIRTNGTHLEKMKVWGKPYLDMYDAILTKYGLPKELKYLSVIESSLISNTTSWAGAAGPWQIMASEAKRMGLKVNGRRDERKNFSKSTHAAAKILKELHKQFNDWTLVIAAYNCGPGRVRQAIRKSGSTNFWDLKAYLPKETRGHVKKFIGTHYIFEGSGGLTTMTESELLDYDNKTAGINQRVFSNSDPNLKTIEIAGRYKANVIAANLEIEMARFNKLNPNLDKLLAKGDTYLLKLPTDKVGLFTSKRNAILNESVQAFLKS